MRRIRLLSLVLGLLLASTLGSPALAHQPYFEEEDIEAGKPWEVVAVWHPEGEVGRYTFVTGEKEKLGGDLAFPFKMRSYWTPVEVPAAEPAPGPAPLQSSCGGR